MISTYEQLVADSAAAAAEQIAPALRRSDELSGQCFEAHLKLIQELAGQVRQLRGQLATLAAQVAEQRGEDIAVSQDTRRRVRALEDIAVSQDRRLGNLKKTVEDMDAGIGQLRGAMTEAESAIADLEVAVFEGEEEESEEAEAEAPAWVNAKYASDDPFPGCNCSICQDRRAKAAEASAKAVKAVAEPLKPTEASRKAIGSVYGWDAQLWLNDYQSLGWFGIPRQGCQCGQCRAARGQTKG